MVLSPFCQHKLTLALSQLTIVCKYTVLTKQAARVRVSSALTSKYGLLQRSKCQQGIHKPMGDIMVAMSVIIIPCECNRHYFSPAFHQRWTFNEKPTMLDTLNKNHTLPNLAPLLSFYIRVIICLQALCNTRNRVMVKVITLSAYVCHNPINTWLLFSC